MLHSRLDFYFFISPRAYIKNRLLYNQDEKKKCYNTCPFQGSGKMTNPHWVFRCFSFSSVSETNTSYWICRVCHLTFVHCIQNDIILMNVYKRNKKFWFSQSQWSSYEDNYTLSQSKYILHYYPHWFESLRYLSISISVYTYIF